MTLQILKPKLYPPYAMPIPFSDCNRNHPSQPGVYSQILIKAKPIPLSDCNSHQVNLEVYSQIIIKAMPNMLYIQIILTACVCHFFVKNIFRVNREMQVD